MRLQAVADRLLMKCDKEPEVQPFMSVLARSIYLAALQVNAAWDTVAGSGKKGVDISPSGADLELLGKRITVSHNWPRGLIGLLTKKSWFNWEYKPAQFIKDENGNTYRLLQGTANMGGLYQVWGNFFTPEPYKHALLCGTNV